MRDPRGWFAMGIRLRPTAGGRIRPTFSADFVPKSSVNFGQLVVQRLVFPGTGMPKPRILGISRSLLRAPRNDRTPASAFRPQDRRHGFPGAATVPVQFPEA